MFEDLTKSVRQQVEDRLSSPLLGAFVIAWCLWNYKFIVVLFSAASVTRTFELVDTLVFPDAWAVFLRGLLFPLLSAGAYIFLYPFPARIVHRAVHQSQKRLLDDRRAIEGQTLLTLDESRRIRAEREQLESSYISEIDRKNKEIDRLRVELASSRARPSPAAEHEKYPAMSPPLPVGDLKVAGEEVLDMPVTSVSLAAYTKWKFPDLEVSEYLNDKTVRDLDVSRYPTIRHINHAVERASDAVNLYHLRKPDLFEYGTDFITKSLGFVDPSFRSKHTFATETLHAFVQYQDKLAAAH